MCNFLVAYVILSAGLIVVLLQTIAFCFLSIRLHVIICQTNYINFVP